MQDTPDIDFRTFARSAGTPVAYRRGDVIFANDDSAADMWIVLSGSVDIEVDGRVIETVGRNFAMGILSLIDHLPRSSTARAREDCELIQISERQFRFMVEQMPNFGWYVMRQLADRLRATNAAL